jgi:hypothetical protein
VRTVTAGHIESLSFREKMVRDSILMTPHHKQQHGIYIETTKAHPFAMCVAPASPHNAVKCFGTYLGSVGLSATLRTKVSNSFRAAPPSPPVRYRMSIWMALSMRVSAGSSVPAAAAVEEIRVLQLAQRWTGTVHSSCGIVADYNIPSSPEYDRTHRTRILTVQHNRTQGTQVTYRAWASWRAGRPSQWRRWR